MSRPQWAYLLQVLGALLVVGGLGYTWASWSDTKVAAWVRGVRGRVHEWWRRIRGKSVQHAVFATDTGTGVMSAQLGVVREPPADDAPWEAWVRHLRTRIDDLEGLAERDRKAASEALARERAAWEAAIAALNEALQAEIRKRHDALREASLNGLGWAAAGALCALLRPSSRLADLAPLPGRRVAPIRGGKPVGATAITLRRIATQGAMNGPV